MICNVYTYLYRHTCCFFFKIVKLMSTGLAMKTLNKENVPLTEIQDDLYLFIEETTFKPIMFATEK